MYRLFTHNDLDGVGCGIVAKLAFGDNVDIRYNSVTGLDFQVERFLEKGNKDDYLLITDLSVNKNNEKRINDFVLKGGQAKLIDHHKTALHFNDYNWGNVKVEYEDGRQTSATSLLYEYFLSRNEIQSSPALEQFVEQVRQFDTWEWDKNENIDAKRLNDLFFMISIDEFEERMIHRIKNNDQFSFDEFEKKLLDLEEEKIERYVRRKRREMVQTFISEYCTGIVHAESYHSELGNELGKESPHLDYIAILNLGGKKISFRTIHDHVDVSEVANKYGGGGHAKAAGCSLTTGAYEYFVAKPFEMDPLRIDSFRNRFNHKGDSTGCLYESRDEDQLFIYETEAGQWALESNHVKQDQEYSSFEDVERHIKREHGAWLVRDEQYIHYLKEKAKEMRKQTSTATIDQIISEYNKEGGNAHISH
ncbi:DHH family phosphoesterase [Bacillus sp. FJAT-45350]|uniref:DHH family phosphoesterase n=1 Tax=Bacillus sp. FJAT-45350 TaxID=2011014 RepID=UPI000BB6B3C1|nr:DHHA1 domain-containing protein [Bacillus sp. FJAT-45350]